MPASPLQQPLLLPDSEQGLNVTTVRRLDHSRPVRLFAPESPLVTPRAQRQRREQRLLSVVAVGIIIAVAAGLGLTLPTSEALASTGSYARISAIVGWSYFACWSLSFWPQVYNNWRRKSVEGLSFDFQVLNFLGFGSYALFNSALFWSDKIREAYREHHHGFDPPVAANDVFFALHALAITAITLIQCVVYERGGQRVSEMCKLAVALAVLGLTAYGVLILIGRQLCTCFTVLNWLYLLSSVKLAVTLIKYIPQIHLNYVRKSTEGWSIGNCLLDFSGGLLSLGQLVADASMTQDWSAVTGNPVKFGLGFVSMVADVIFFTQHYWLYPESRRGPVLPRVAPPPAFKELSRSHSHLTYVSDDLDHVSVASSEGDEGKALLPSQDTLVTVVTAHKRV